MSKRSIVTLVSGVLLACAGAASGDCANTKKM